MTPQEASEYIAALLEGLKLVAHNELPFLAYLLNVALQEAQSTKTRDKRMS